MITILEDPIKTVGTRLSNVIAARSQVRYKVSQSVSVPAAGQRIAVRVKEIGTGTLLTPIEFKYSADQNGELVIDLSQICVDILTANDWTSMECYFEFEDFPNVDGDPVVLTDPIVAAYSEKQLATTGGSNMWPYLLNNIPLGFSPTLFREPKLWEGWRRTFPLILDPNMAGSLLDPRFFVVEELDNQKNVLATRQNEPYILDSGLHNLEIDTSSIPDNVKYLRAYMTDDVGTQLYDYKDYSVECEHDEPIYVEWLNSLGGLEQHLFQINQDVNVRVSPGPTFDVSNDDDIADVRTTKFRLNQTYTQRLTLTVENIDGAFLDAVKEIKYSPAVRVLITRTSGDGVTGVPVIDFSTTHSTGDETQDFTFILEMPDNFDIYKSLLYDALDLLAPSGLTAVNTAAGEVTLNWTSNSANFEQGFEIQRSDSPSFGSPTSFNVGTGVTNYVDNIGTPDIYYYRVRATGGIDSDWSNIETVFVMVDQDALNWTDNMTSPTDNQRKLIDLFVIAEKAAGNWATRDEYWLLDLGSTNSLVGSAGTVLVQNVTPPLVTFDSEGIEYTVQSDTFLSIGKSLASLTNYQLGDGNVTYYIYDNNYSSGSVYYGGAFDGANFDQMSQLGSGLNNFLQSGGGGNLAIQPANSTLAFTVNGTNRAVVINGVPTAIGSAATAGLSTNDFHFGARNTGSGDFCLPAKFGMYSIGSEIGFDHVAHDTNVRNYLGV